MTKMCLKFPIPLLFLRGMGIYKVLNEDPSSFYTNPLCRFNFVFKSALSDSMALFVFGIFNSG